MAALVANFAHPLILFVLVLARVGALVLTAPLFGQGVPRHIRGLLAVALAALVTPMYLRVTYLPPRDLTGLGLMVANEMLVGLLLGVGIQILFIAVQVAGQLISQLSGMSLADVFSPGFNANVPMFSQLLFYMTMAVMVCLGGYRLVIEALLDTFTVLPPGASAMNGGIGEMLATILNESLALGIRAGAPVMTALLLSTLVLGLVTRTLPQINIIAVGFGLNAFLTLGILLLSLGTIAWTLQEGMRPTLRLIVDTLG